ncbi:hypothetical protein [Rhodoferax sp. PAMC 29310]|uniref:type IV pilus modification PilV family protein n=1 Tax=Rhodoferax sp. PAMC 29310 TaxID=2822760 RepID=UPI001B33F747|nr:hypothetical protein [Rhodoferax sp. PAMC 29310]
MKKKSLMKSQKGSALLEAMVAILVFSFGILGLLGLQAVSIKNSIDAKYRSDASYIANQIIAQMWVDRSNIDSYAHLQAGAVCAYTGTASTNANVTGWISQASSQLPGAASAKTQILVTTPVAGIRQVKVTVCWQGPQETTPHNFATTAQINQ